MVDNHAWNTLVHRSWRETSPIIERGEGIYLFDTTGNRYIDGSAGASVVVNIGHGVRSVVDAMYEQGKRVALVASHVFATEPALALAQMVAERAPGAMRADCRVWFSNTGTDSTDDAARLARQYFVTAGKGAKSVIIGRWQSFHGNGLGTAGFSGHTYRRRLYLPMFVSSPLIPPAYCYRCPFGLALPACGLRCARYLETMIHQIGAENVAAFIAEPVVGAALGAVPAPDGYFQVVREICDRHDVLFIADEVMTGWGRIGSWFGIEQWGVTPDIVATAKGMASGYTAIAATIGREEVWRVIAEGGAPFVAGHTLNANPVSCAAAIANLKYVEQHDVLGNVRAVGPYLLQRLQELLEFDIVGDVRGKGMMCGLELVMDRATKEPFPADLHASAILQSEALKRGLVIYSCTGCVEGVGGDMALVTPPLVITRAQVDELMAILKEAVQATRTRLRSD